MDMLIAILVVAIVCGLGFIVYAQDRGRIDSKIFLILCFMLAGWTLSNVVTNHYFGTDPYINTIANRLAYLFGLLSVASGLLFTYVFPIKQKIKTSTRIVLTILIAVTSLLSLTSYVSGEVFVRNEKLEFTNGPLLIEYALTFVVVIGYMVKNLFYAIRKARGVLRHQAWVVLFAFASSATVGLLTNVLLPLAGLDFAATTKFAPIAVIVLMVIISYSIIRHRLFNIKVAAVRSAAYVLSLITLALIYYGIVFFVSKIVFSNYSLLTSNFSLVNVASALVLAFLFQPIRSFYDRITSKIFFSDTYAIDEFVSHVGSVLTSTTHLRSLLKLLSREMAEMLKAEHMSFAILQSQNRVTTEGTQSFTKFGYKDTVTLLDYMQDNQITILNLDDNKLNTKIRRIMVGYHVVLVILMKTESRQVGLYSLGQRKAGNYSSKDIKALLTITDELVIAVQNTLSLQEVREFNSTLQQRIDSATEELRKSNEQLRSLDEAKDEFLSMASHQLRTPLTSVKGYLSMVIEGDVGKVSADQKRLLSEAFKSSERMVRLINDFLNVSRIQTGKFMIEKNTTNLTKLVKQEVESLQSIALSHGVTLKAVLPDQAISQDIDEGKIRQVIMNFIDNAIYYSKPKGTVTVKLTTRSKYVTVEVKDEGIGVPLKQQQKLFSKFFRAENAKRQRPDGTGVGLYLAKKVVDGHGGKIIFSSTEGKGSLFGFRLPVKNTNQADSKNN